MVLLTTIVERSCGTELGLTTATVSLHVMLNEGPREPIAHVSEVTEVVILSIGKSEKISIAAR